MAWSDIRSNYARWGAQRALHISLMNLLGRIGFQLVYVYTRALVDYSNAPFEEDGIAYRSLTKTDLRKASLDLELDLTPEFLTRAWSRGDLCCGAFHGDKLVSYAWRSGVEAEHVPGLKVVVANNCRYGYKAFTRPEYRGRGIYPRLTGLEDREYIKRGKTTVIAFSASHNYASRELDKKLGNRTIGLAGYWKIGKHFLLFHTPGVKKHGFSFARDHDG